MSQKALPIVVGALFLLATMMGAPMVHAKRAAPANIAPIIHKGIKYVSDHEKTPGKFIILVKAERLSDGVVLWKSELYSISYDPSLERDAQEVYLSSMILKGNRIKTIDEKGNRHIVDIRDGSVLPILFKSAFGS